MSRSLVIASPINKTSLGIAFCNLWKTIDWYFYFNIIRIQRMYLNGAYIYNFIKYKNVFFLLFSLEKNCELYPRPTQNTWVTLESQVKM